MSEKSTMIRRTARELCYRQLDDLISREVTVNHLDSVEQDIYAALSDVLPRGCEYVATEQQFLEGAMVKYGIIDVTITAPEEPFSSRDKGGISLLKELGFVEEEDKEHSNTHSDILGCDTSCLDSLAEGIDNKQTLIKLFLVANRPAIDLSDLVLKMREGSLSLTVPDSYLPRIFQVDDACLTNSDFVWFQKHFYL